MMKQDDDGRQRKDSTFLKKNSFYFKIGSHEVAGSTGRLHAPSTQSPH